MKTFEMVLGGHPDKVCDIIAERIKNKIGGRSAVEVVWFNNKIIVGGEVGMLITKAEVKSLVSEVLDELNYFEYIEVENLLQTQSQEIADIIQERGAGDNGIFYAGYHARWTPIIDKLKNIALQLTKVAILYNYRTDGKFIAKFNDKGVLLRFTLNIASNKNQSEDERQEFEDYLYSMLDLAFNKKYELYINPKGLWFKCGGFADSGLTGRKLACDNSMGLFHQGGGAFFGKDVSKADYSIPLFLHHKAKQYANNNGLAVVELMAHTIIGDERVDIYTVEGKHLSRYTFAEIMEFAEENKMSWVGLL